MGAAIFVGLILSGYFMVLYMCIRKLYTWVVEAFERGSMFEVILYSGCIAIVVVIMIIKMVDICISANW